MTETGSRADQGRPRWPFSAPLCTLKCHHLPSFRSQILSFANSVVLGVLLGVAFGAVNFVATIFSPLAEDTAPRVIGFYGLMFAMWGAASFVVCRRSGRFMDAITTGVMVGAVTVAVFHI